MLYCSLRILADFHAVSPDIADDAAANVQHGVLLSLYSCANVIRYFTLLNISPATLPDFYARPLASRESAPIANDGTGISDR